MSTLLYQCNVGSVHCALCKTRQAQHRVTLLPLIWWFNRWINRRQDLISFQFCQTRLHFILDLIEIFKYKGLNELIIKTPKCWTIKLIYYAAIRLVLSSYSYSMLLVLNKGICKHNATLSIMNDIRLQLQWTFTITLFFTSWPTTYLV